MDDVTMKAFEFTKEQGKNLRKGKDLLNTELAQEWHEENSEAIEAIKSILDDVKFQEGNDLTGSQLDQIFYEMRKIVSNRILSRSLYEDNGLSTFNFALRNLLYSSDPFIERISQFLKLRRAGIMTVSHFLCASNPYEYPIVTSQTIEVLDLDANQNNMAYRQALVENKISSPDIYYDDTLDYLTNVVIYREVKNLLGIELYTDINNILWLARDQVLGAESIPISSVSLEKDLRDYIANNPSVVEKGLRLIKKEYPTPIGSIDILCQGKRNKYVAIETKKGSESDKVVGQILRYIGSLEDEGKSARGIIILNEPDERVDYALKPIGDLVKVMYYKVSFEIRESYEA